MRLGSVIVCDLLYCVQICWSKNKDGAGKDMKSGALCVYFCMWKSRESCLISVLYNMHNFGAPLDTHGIHDCIINQSPY